MAALGKILRKGGGGGKQSVYQTAQYERLNQDPSDNDEEEDDILYIQDGAAPKQNGFTHNKDSAKTELLPNGGDSESIELGDLGIQSGRIRKASEVEVRTLRHRSLTWTRTVCFVLTLIVAIGFVIGLIFVLPDISDKFSHRHQFKQTEEWNHTFSEYGTESQIQLLDVDEDGRLDILVTVVPGVEMGRSEQTRANEEVYCKTHGYTTVPCVAQIQAIRGYDGALLWRIEAHSSIFEMNCGNIDIDLDGKMDCIGTGRLGTIVAFDPRKGIVFWRGHTLQLEDKWNIYNVLILPDLSADGVSDVLVAHGGDLSFPPQVVDRHAGRLLVVDGRTGRMLGTRYLEMPDSKETYMSPIMHTRRDGSQYVLFGHGGETVPGTLFAISIPALFNYVMKRNESSAALGLKGKYGDWGKLPATEQGFMEIYRSQKKGVMTPPVCIDMTGDGVKDILMSAYEGLITLYDGETLQQIWSTQFPGMESYSTPAPGYFNDDDTPDFMLHQNVGAWPSYNLTQVLILDGKTGQIIWQMNSSWVDMTSDLVARTTENHRDMFIYRVTGREHYDKKAQSSNRKRRSLDGTQFLQNHRRKNGPHIPDPPSRRRGNTWPPEQDSQYNNRDYRYKQTRLPDNQRSNMGRYGNQREQDPYGRTGYDQRNYFGQPDYDDDVDFPGSMADMNFQDSLYSTLADIDSNYLDPDEEETSREDDHHSDQAGEDEDEEDGEDDDDDDDDDGVTCLNEPSLVTTEVFIMDRTIASAPFRLYNYQPDKQVYNFTALERKELGIPEVVASHVETQATTTFPIRSKRHGMHKDAETEYPFSNEACVLMSLQDRSTGAIGDVDGDGTLDYVFLLDASGSVRDANTQAYIRQKVETTVIKINLETRVIMSQNSHQFIPVKSKLKDLNLNNGDKLFSETKFRPYGEQLWTKYMGKYSNSIYEEVKSKS